MKYWVSWKKEREELIPGSSCVRHLAVLWQSGPASVSPVKFSNKMRRGGKMTIGIEFTVLILYSFAFKKYFNITCQCLCSCLFWFQKSNNKKRLKPWLPQMFLEPDSPPTLPAFTGEECISREKWLNEDRQKKECSKGKTMWDGFPCNYMFHRSSMTSKDKRD